MAATASAWAKPGAWALDSEEQESELVQLKRDDSINSNGHAKNGDYPTLAAANAATKTKKKSKGQTLSLQEFSNYGTTAKQPTFQASKGLTPDELMSLPTGPRQRSAEELERSKGFRSYGTRDEQPRRARESSRDFAPLPSRADEIDDWGAAKKFTAAPNGFERRERREGGGFFSDSQSRADEVDNWASNKTFVPSDGGRRNERRGFDSNGGGGRADSDNWGKRKEEEGRKYGSLGGAFDSLRERRGGGSTDSLNGGSGIDSDNWGGKRREESSGGRPRLNLQPRTLPLVGGGQPQQLQSNEILVKPKGTGSSPFGDARPREEVLKGKGQDWKEIEEKLESGRIKETGEERPPAAFGKRGFGSGSWRGSLQEDRGGERTWKNPAETVDARPSSAENKEDGPGEEAEDKEPEI